MKKIFVICNTFRHVISVDKKKGEQAMRDTYVSKRNKKKSLILQGIKPHRAKECMVHGDQNKAKISS